ncbi:MAG: hypothetical protein WCO66_04990, partial [Candidatus Absconditabacteria bacterium]
MEYKVLYDNKDDSLLMRLLKIRNVEEHIDQFLDPKLSDFWKDPFLLNDMEKAVDRIIVAIKNQEKIMIFGDYDVDGVTSSYILYKCFTKYLGYKNISITYPDRIKDGYGMKCHHIDSMKAKAARPAGKSSAAIIKELRDTLAIYTSDIEADQLQTKVFA